MAIPNPLLAMWRVLVRVAIQEAFKEWRRQTEVEVVGGGRKVAEDVNADIDRRTGG